MSGIGSNGSGRTHFLVNDLPTTLFHFKGCGGALGTVCTNFGCVEGQPGRTEVICFGASKQWRGVLICCRCAPLEFQLLLFHSCETVRLRLRLSAVQTPHITVEAQVRGFPPVLLAHQTCMAIFFSILCNVNGRWGMIVPHFAGCSSASAVQRHHPPDHRNPPNKQKMNTNQQHPS